MEYTIEDGRLMLRRTAEEREPILKRLRRVEGQVRGLQQMVEADRHCLDEVQQVNAVTAAMREVALAIVGDHLEAAVAFAVEAHDGQVAVREMIAVLRAALRQQG